MSQKPYIAHFFYPGIIGSTSPDFYIFDPIISEPASPNPRANKTPILIIAFSIIIVSKFSPSSLTNYYSLADIGFLAILFTLSNNLSIGRRAKSLASLEKYKAPHVNTIQT